MHSNMSHIASEDFSEITSGDQYPETINICSGNQLKQNWKCMILTGLILSCLLSVLLCHRQQAPNHINVNQTQDYFASNRDVCWTLIFCAIILYSLYLMECSYATEKIQLFNCNTESVEDVKEKIERMKNSDPIVWWKATCYHYARRKRRTTRFRGGKYLVSTKVFQERVNSFSSSATFNFSCCGVKDISNNLMLDDSSGSVVKFRFSKGFAFSNMASAVEFEEQRSVFFRELRRYDEYMDVHEGLDLTDCTTFKEEVLALNTSGRKPWFANPFYYWVYSCCLLSWPFRVILSYNTVYVHYKITKLFGTNYNNLSDSTHELTLLQLYDTRTYSLNENIDTPVWSDVATTNASTGTIHQIGSELAPSYSEALLLLDDQQTVVIDDRNVQNIPDENVGKTCISIAKRNERIYHGCDALTGFIPPSFQEHEVSSNEISSTGNMNADDPPAYEEALMFPVIEHVPSNANERNIYSNENINQLQTHAQTESRLPNSRMFLSIETSL